MGLSMDDVVKAVLEGLEQGRKETGVQFGLILCAMRNQSPNISLEIAKLAVAYRDRGVVGFDLAGDEKVVNFIFSECAIAFFSNR